MRLGSLSRRAIASGATASGGETIAPSRKPTDQGTDKTNCAATATATVVNMTHPKASRVIVRRLNRNSRQLIDTADE
jgi:hypothetical protein